MSKRIYTWDQDAPEYSDIEIMFAMDDGVNYPAGTVTNADSLPCLDDDDANETDKMTRETARLWCAAPDLLAACEAFVNAKTPGDHYFALEAARAAIAKAEGGQP